ncbi:DUF11 domain-containing protein [Deinococcus sp.]|uniref:DUF11 domain-containing protein n=1 Tax=Deinococcus sp. TaxID=47478 RepID=UPI003C7E7A46
MRSLRYTTTQLLVLLLALLGLAGAAGTPAGTVIENQALFQALPGDPSEAPISASSERVGTVVERVCSLSVLPNGTLATPGQSVDLLPGEVATLHYTLTNTGNAPNTYALSAGSDASSAFKPGDLGVYPDRNANGVIDPGEAAISSLSLPADASAALLVRVGSDAASRGNAFINLTAACAASLGGASDQNHVARVTVLDPPALTLSKSFSAARVMPGGTVGVTLTLGNSGQGASREVLVSDLLDAGDMSGFAYVPGSATAEAGHLEYSTDGSAWQPGESGTVLGLRWRLDSLAAGASARLSFRLVAPNAEVGTRRNVASLSSSGAPDTQAAASVEVRYAPAIALGPVGNPQANPGGELSGDDLQSVPQAFAGQEVCFRQTEQNLGDRPDDLSVRFQLSAGQATVRLLEIDGSALTRALTLAPAASHDFLACVTPTQGSSAPIELRLIASGVRGAAENVTLDKVAALILGQPKLTKTVTPTGTIKPGDLLTYTLTVQNPLSADLSGVTLRDPLDAHLAFVSAEGGSVNGGAVTWNIGALPAGQTVTRTLVARVLAGTPDDTVISNAFTFSSMEFAAALTSAPVTSPVFAGGLIFSKTSTPAEVSIGDLMTYTFLVRNPSTVATLRLVEINDAMPVGLEYIPGSSSFNGSPITDPTITGINHVWTLPELGPGAQHEVVFLARVLPSATGDRIQNTAIARAISANGSEIPRISASATNRITPLLFAPIADVVGYVFQDLNRDGGYQQGIDLPVQNARVILANGRIALTDAAGRYHFGSVREGFTNLRLDPSSVAQQPLSVPQDGGRPGSRGVNVRGVTSIDFPLKPNTADIGVIRDTTLVMGTTQNPGLLQLRKQVFSTDQEGVYRVQLDLTAAQALPLFTLTDPLPTGAALEGGVNTLSLPGLPTGPRTLTYTFRFAGSPAAAVTDPLAGWGAP